MFPQVSSEKFKFEAGEAIYEYDNASKPLGEGTYGRVFNGKVMINIQTHIICVKTV